MSDRIRRDFIVRTVRIARTKRKSTAYTERSPEWYRSKGKSIVRITTRGEVMSVLYPLAELGLKVSVSESGKLKIQGLSRLTPDEAEHVLAYARSHKPAILAALSQTEKPAECESCRAAGYWDSGEYAGALLCFYSACFLGKAGRPHPCDEQRKRCPQKKPGA